MAKPPTKGASRSSTPRPQRTIRVAEELLRPIATTRNGRDITRPWRAELEDARDPRLRSSVDWGVYDKVARDPEVRSTFQQRRRAVTSAEWDLIPGDGKDPRSVEAADRMKANLDEVGLDRVFEKMLWAVMNGYAVAEVNWGVRDGQYWFLPGDNCRPIHVRHARRFRRHQDGSIRLLTAANASTGELMPERKFWWVSTGGSDDDEFYGWGLAADLYWPVLMKRNGLGFWNVALDKFGTPTAIGTYRRGTTQADIDKLLEAIEAIATDSGIAIPEGMKVELLEAAAKGDAGFEKLVRYCDEQIGKVVLSQTMTTSDGSSLAQAQVHAGVKLEVVTSDADLICESFNEGPATWWTLFNYGADVAPPQLIRLLDEEDDLEKRTKIDVALKRLGYVRTEDSFKDTYGDGYEAAAAPEVALAPGDLVVNDKQDGDRQNEDAVVPFRRRGASFAENDANDGDVIDLVVADLIAGAGYTALAPAMAPIADAIARSGSAEELDAALIATLTQYDADRLVEALARAGFATRVAAETGAEQEMETGR